MQYYTGMALTRQQEAVRLLFRRVLLLGLIFLVVFLSWAVWGVYRKNQVAAELRAQSEHKLSDLQAHYEALSASIEMLSTDRGREQLLRETRDMGKPGEKLIVIINSSASSGTVPLSTSTPKAWWRFW